MDFISDINYSTHKEAAGRDILRLGLLERSHPGIATASPKAIARMRARGVDMRAAAELKASVILHRVFFDSFSDEGAVPSAAVRRIFGSEAALLTRLYDSAMKLRIGFAAVVKSGREALVCASENALDILLAGEPILAVDLFEHAYYGDYGFGKEAYLRDALTHLKLGKLDAVCP